MRVADGIATYGIDLGKSKFHVVGLDQHGRVTLRRSFRRDGMLQFFANVPAALIGMEPVRARIGCQGS